MKARQGVGYVHRRADPCGKTSTLQDVPADGETMGEVIMRGKQRHERVLRAPRGHRGGRSEAAGFHSGDTSR